MAEDANAKKISLEELMVSSLAMTDAIAKLLIARGIITDAEFKAQLSGAGELRGCAEADPVGLWRQTKSCREKRYNIAHSQEVPVIIRNNDGRNEAKSNEMGDWSHWSHFGHVIRA